ncbi:hypothetical protein D3C81_1920400 [compost metagenome]
MGAVQSVGNDVFTAHCTVVAALLLGFFHRGHGHAGDGDFNGHHRIDGGGKGHLNRASHLTAVNACAHHRAKGTHVEEVDAHPVGQLLGLRQVFG